MRSERGTDADPAERAQETHFDDDRVGLVKEPFVSGIDLIRDEHDQPLLAELELVEPSLFLRQEPAALKRLVRGIAARL